MAHNIMRVDSINDRYVTETMIDLSLNLNEEIDFDFFDNVETPNKKLETKKNNPVSASLSRSCSPQPFEDDDDVQVSQHPLSYNGRTSKCISAGKAIEDINASSDSTDEPLSTGTENDEKFEDNFGENEPLQICKDVNIKLCASEPEDNISPAAEKSSPVVSKLTDKSSSDGILITKQYVSEENNILINESSKRDDVPLGSKFHENNVEDTPSKSPSIAIIMSSQTTNEDRSSLSSLKKDDEALMECGENHTNAVSKSNESLDERGCVKFSKNHKDDVSSKSGESVKAEGSGSGYDSDEGCPYEGSDSDELLVGVHTLTIIPRENDEESLRRTPIVCEQTSKAEGSKVIHSTSCEKAAITARSSSGYSSASCKAHGCIVSRGTTSKADSRLSSKMEMHTPDMNEIIKSFRKMQSSPQVSFADKYSSTSKNRPRRNMSFSNEELKRIERENAILLNKIVLQQRARPAVVHKYERRVTSNEINRTRQSKKIEYDNEILLRKIQDVKRKSTLSAQSSRCTSQASTSQF